MKTRVPLWLFVIAIVGAMSQSGFAQTPAPPPLSPSAPEHVSVSSEPPQANGKKPISFSARSVQGILAKEKQNTILTGSVKITTGSLVITADRVELSGEDYVNVVCSGSITVNDTEKGFSLVAERLYYRRDTEIGIAQGKVAVNDTKNKTTIDAEWLRFDQQQSTFEAAVSVLVLKEDMSIRAEYAHYNRNTEEIKLHGGAIAITEDGSIKGDVISTASDWSNLQVSGEVSGIITTEKKSASQ